MKVETGYESITGWVPLKATLIFESEKEASTFYEFLSALDETRYIGRLPRQDEVDKMLYKLWSFLGNELGYE